MVNIILLGILLSLLPIGELRVGIPLLISNGIDPVLAFLICASANIFIIPILFVFLDYIHSGMLRFPFYNGGFGFFLKRFRNKAKTMKADISRYGLLALALFVAIPLPFTGAYSGVLIAWLLDIERKKAAWYIAIGVLIAGVVVTLASLGIIAFIGINAGAS